MKPITKKTNFGFGFLNPGVTFSSDFIKIGAEFHFYVITEVIFMNRLNLTFFFPSNKLTK
jgi:hypothetical protein